MSINIKANKEVIPASASLSDSMYYVNESMEEEYNSIMRDLALNELGVLESTGIEVVYEGAVLTEATDKIAGFVDSNYSKIKGMYEKFLSEQKAKSDKLASGISAKSKKIIAAGLSSLENKELTKSYSYSNLESAKTGSEGNKIWKAINYLQAQASVVNDTNVDQVKKKFATIVGANSTSISDVKQAAITYLRGEKTVSITTKIVASNFDDMWNCVFNYKTISGEVKGCLNKTKAAFNGLKSASSKGAEDAVTKERIKFQKYAAQAISALNNAILLVYKEQLETNRKLVWKVSTQCLKKAPIKKEEAPKKEEKKVASVKEVAEIAKNFAIDNNMTLSEEAIIAMHEAGVDVSDLVPVTEAETINDIFNFDLED